MGIVRKFAVALGSMLALVFLVAVAGFVALNALERKAGAIVAESMDMQRLALEMDSRLQLARQAEQDFTLHIKDLGLERARVAYVPEFRRRLGEVERNLTWLRELEGRALDQDAEQQAAARFALLRGAIENYGRLFDNMIGLAASVDPEDPRFSHALGEMEGQSMELTSQVRQLAISAADGARRAHEEIAQSSMLAKYALIVSVILALLLVGVIFQVLNQSVARSVVQLSDAANELSLGNLQARARVDSDDEFGMLAGSINSMAHRINVLVNDLESKAAVASDRLMEAIDSISESFLLYDHRERLVVANRQAKDLIGFKGAYLRPGITAEQLIRFAAESGQFLNAQGRETEWAQERLDLHRSPCPPVEEPLRDGRWVLIKTYRSGRGETVVIISDITERKHKAQVLSTMNADLEDLVRERTKVLVDKAMELKRANRRLMELDELKSAFLSSVSHELRTPLTSLLGFSKIIKRDFSRTFMPLADTDHARSLGGRIQSNLEIIGSEGERLTRLINDVLDLSRIESGQENWRFTEVDLAGCVHRAVSAASGLVSPKPSVRLSVRRLDPVPLVHADSDRIHQVLMNLLSNAVKFTDCGEVSVDVFQDADGMVRVCVEDTGCGIRNRYLEQIFDKFHQVHKGDTLTEKPSGTGLGLAICRQIVEHYGGRIWAESRLGRGTVIHVSLPPADPPDKPLVLVVDDDPAVRDYLSMLLKREGYGVHAACDGEDALRQVLRRRPALITMDILMPGMDGRAAIRELRRDVNLADIPVLVVSVIDGCQDAGGDAALLKPINGDAFIGAVHALIGDGGPDRPVLAIGPVPAPGSCSLPSLCGESVARCSEDELWGVLDGGFEGTVVVSESMADTLDLPRICGLSNVQVLLLPREAQAVGDPLSPPRA
jgi:signal transduction histidine kinase